MHDNCESAMEENTGFLLLHLPFRTQKMYYHRMALTCGTASQCLECHHCERLCPQHLPIPQLLKKGAQVFGK